MYIHIGGDYAVHIHDIIAVLDLDNTIGTGVSQEFMRKAEKQGKIINAAKDLPRAMLITDREIYITSLSAQAISKRANEVRVRKG